MEEIYAWTGGLIIAGLIIYGLKAIAYQIIDIIKH